MEERIKKLFLVGLVALVLGACAEKDGTLVIVNDTSQPDCAPPLRVDTGGAFTVEVGKSASFKLEPGDYLLSLAGPEPPGCNYTGGFHVDNECPFEIEEEETTIIRLVDDGEGYVAVGRTSGCK